MAATTAAKNPGALGVGSMLSREKYWGELKTDEKIERLRNLLKSCVAENDRLRRKLSVFNRHTHDESGKAVSVKPLSEDYDEYGAQVGMKSVSSNPDDVYI